MLGQILVTTIAVITMIIGLITISNDTHQTSHTHN
jgi:hypothetical protein